MVIQKKYSVSIRWRRMALNHRLIAELSLIQLEDFLQATNVNKQQLPLNQYTRKASISAERPERLHGQMAVQQL